MKKIYALLFTLLLCGTLKTNATIVMVGVSDFQFSPSNFVVNTGDTIMWFWVSGFHTTTSDNIPGAATSWDEPIDQNNPGFMYIPTVPGTYTYDCDFHSQMEAQFTVNTSVGISEATVPAQLSLNFVSPATTVLQVSYGLPQAAMVHLKMFDLLGNEVQTLSAATQQAGLYSHLFNIEGLPKGIYILRLQAGDAIIARRILLQ